MASYYSISCEKIFSVLASAFIFVGPDLGLCWKVRSSFVLLTWPFCHFSKNRNLALEGLAAVVNRVTCSAPVPGSTLYVHACHPRGALPAPGLAGCPVGCGE